ncbi:MAG TPA: hypothetical protein ENN13_00270 [Candidatus Altiarchaeales archaeon]|nr:hypothetical protein [Candidatus Altiarchaeales archaeon]
MSKIMLVLAMAVFACGCSRCVENVDFNKCLDALEGPARDECVRIALENVNCVDTCMGLEDEDFRNQCLKSLALNRQNRFYCGQITDEGLKKECVESCNTP